MNNRELLQSNRITLLITIFVIFFYPFYSFSQESRILKGVILDKSTNEPIPNTTVASSSTLQSISDEAGRFEIKVEESSGELVVSHLNYINLNFHYDLNNSSDLVIYLINSSTSIEEVFINTGYQNIPKSQIVGSTVVLDEQILNSRTGENMFSIIKNLVPGMLFNEGDAAQMDEILIRGRSTFTGDARPLIVLDNFPFEGDIESINPADISTVTVLKDASSASIWGARAANGVIVLTSKKGTTPRPKLSFNSNYSIRNRPNIFNIPSISSSDLMDYTEYLFDNGIFDVASNGTLSRNTRPIPAYVELLIKGDLESNQDLISRMRSQDVRDDISTYLYQPQVFWQNTVSISGVGDRAQYYFSTGYNKSQLENVGSKRDKLMLNGRMTFNLHPSVNITTSYNFVNDRQQQGHNNGLNVGALGSQVLEYSPYNFLINPSGTPAPIFNVFREGYIDTAGNGLLLDWVFRPVEEIYKEVHAQNHFTNILSAGADIQIFQGLNLTANYQYENQFSKLSSHYKENSYRARHEVNRFTQIPSVDNVIRPVPMGGILEQGSRMANSHQGRIQYNYLYRSSDVHEVSSIGGAEIRTRLMKNKQYGNEYGYKEDLGLTNRTIDFENYYPIYHSSGRARITNRQNYMQNTDNFISYYANVMYGYREKYRFYGSVRKDEANLFGVDANMKGVPLWSIGGAWSIDKERFYKSDLLSSLRLRLSYGVNGNISRRATALTTAVFRVGSDHSDLAGNIISPPNRNLKWEQVKMLNVGIDATFGRSRQGLVVIDFYKKWSSDLVTQTPLDPTMGFTSAFRNTAEMEGQGIDIQLSYTWLKQHLFKWRSVLNHSLYKGEVTKYLMPISNQGSFYLNPSIANPIIGKPLYSVYSLPWAGLDPANGNPLGYYEGEVSDDYILLYSSSKLQDLKNHGSLHPSHFGSFRNELGFGKFDVVFNISYALGHYFRVNSISNLALNTGWVAHGDFSKRWQQPGDEKYTNVPSMLLTANSTRDNFYRYSSVLVHRADYVRIDDVYIGYNNVFKIGGMDLVRLYAHISNIGAVWVRNTLKVDPKYNSVPSYGPNYSLGINIQI